MEKSILFEDWGRMDYKQAWDRQSLLFNEQLERKNLDIPTSSRLIFVEHLPVYTLGKSGDSANLFISEIKLKEIGATYYHIDRGGDITFHGPGQLVGYPILDLAWLGIGIRKYIWSLEEVIIRFLENEYGIASGRTEKASGVWLDEGAGLRKICAIGTRVSRQLTMHGFAFNVNTDLSYFSYINPCGLTAMGVTSLEKETGTKQNFETVKKKIIPYFEKVFEFEINKS